MTADDRTYKLYILKKVIHEYLDEIFPDTEENLNSFVSNHDDIVWEIAKKIYSKSGHKVEFFVIKNVINSRISSLKARLANEQSKVTNKEQNSLIESVGQSEDFDKEVNATDLYQRIQYLISEQLSVGLNEVTLNSHITYDLGADGLDTIELALALEEEFNIEIPDKILGGVWCNPLSSVVSSGIVPIPRACTVRELSTYIHKCLFNDNSNSGE